MNVSTQYQLSDVTDIRCLKTVLQRGARQIKDSIAEETKERCQGKRIHGQFTS